MEEDVASKVGEFGHWLLENNAIDNMIYVVCVFLIFAFLVVSLTKKLKLPSVVGYVVLGVLLSVNIIKLLPFFSIEQIQWYHYTTESMMFISEITLAFIAFTVGSELSIKIIKKLGKSVAYITLFQVFMTFFIVTLALLAIGKSIHLALIFGAIATVTAPSTTVMTINEYKAKGQVTSLIMATVGIGAAISLFIYSLVSPLAYIIYSGQGSVSLMNSLMLPVSKILGAIFIGALTGGISLYLITNLHDKTKKILLILATIVGGLGISKYFGVSPLIANMAIGFVYRNFAKKNLGIAEYLDTFTIPLYAFFFILAGVEIRFEGILEASFLLLAFVYTFSRIAGKVTGATWGASVSKSDEKARRYVGWGILPQGGVALALAFSASRQFAGVEEIGILIFNVILFTAILSEIFGPLFAKNCLVKSGEISEVLNPNQSTIVKGSGL